MKIWAFEKSDKDNRPFVEKGFKEVEPVVVYPSLSPSDLRNDEWGIKKDGSDPAQCMHQMQLQSKDSGQGKKKGPNY